MSVSLVLYLTKQTFLFQLFKIRFSSFGSWSGSVENILDLDPAKWSGSFGSGSVTPVFNGRVVLSSCVCYTILQIFWRHSHPVLTCCNDYLGKRTCLYRYCIYLWQCSASGVTTNRRLSIFSRSDLDYLTLNDALHQIKNNLCFIETGDYQGLRFEA